MNANLDKIALDLYGKIQTRFPDITIGDENAAVLSKKEDIPNARFFEFEYKENGDPRGTIAITLDANDGIVVQVSGDLVNDDNNNSNHSAYKFIRSFRQFAKDRLLNFDIQNIGKSNLDKRDYQFQAKRKEEPVMAQAPIMENKMYGNARMSYQDLGEARLVVKHSQPVNAELAAGRTMHIDSIYIENAQGERFKYPFKHLNGARALAEHIKHGGNPYDGIGKHICSLSEELASLRKFKGFVSRQEQISEAMGSVTDRVIERIDQIKETIQKLQRSAYYESFVESFEEQEEQMIPEEIQNDLIDRLTIRTFNEELKSVFPYIAKFVKESELPVLEIGAEDLLDEVFDGDKEEGTTHKGGKVTKTKHGVKHEKTDYDDGQKDWNRKDPKNRWKHDAILDPEDQFESFIEDIVREDKDEVFSGIPGARNRAIEELNTLLAGELAGGSVGVMAFKGLIDDPELMNKIEVLDQDAEIRQELKDYILDKNPKLITLLTNLDKAPEEVGGQDVAPAPAPEPVAAPAPAAAPVEPMAAPAAQPAPIAEGEKEGSWRSETPWKKSDPKKNPEGKVHNLAGQALKKTIEKAKKAGATLETQLDFGHGVKTIAEIIAECGMEPAEFGFEQEQDPLDSMLKFVSSFYNKESRSFPLGGTRVKIKVKKAYEDGEFGDAEQADVIKVLKFIDAKDPSGNEHNQIMRLSGVPQQERTVDEELPNQTNLDFSDIENKLKGMKLKFGDQEFDFNDPSVGDKIGQTMQKQIGGMMQGVANQTPNQNVQVPGGQINPQEFMRALLQKMGQGQ